MEERRGREEIEEEGKLGAREKGTKGEGVNRRIRTKKLRDGEGRGGEGKRERERECE